MHARIPNGADARSFLSWRSRPKGCADHWAFCFTPRAYFLHQTSSSWRGVLPPASRQRRTWTFVWRFIPSRLTRSLPQLVNEWIGSRSGKVAVDGESIDSWHSKSVLVSTSRASVADSWSVG